MSSYSVFIHVYYPGSWKLIKEKCSYLLDTAASIIVTACHDDVIAEIDIARAVIFKVTNVGKDIGGKLVGMAYYLQFCQPASYVILLHDKISPQTINADFWFNQLFGIFEEEKLKSIIQLLNSSRDTGIAGSKYFLKNEYIRSEKKFDTTNSQILASLISEYALTCKSYDYIGGTIFIAKSRIFSAFFTRYPPLAIREKLEPGNVLDLEHGTYTHAWERMLCFIAQDQGYAVIGV